MSFSEDEASATTLQDSDVHMTVMIFVASCDDADADDDDEEKSLIDWTLLDEAEKSLPLKRKTRNSIAAGGVVVVAFIVGIWNLCSPQV